MTWLNVGDRKEGGDTKLKVIVLTPGVTVTFFCISKRICDDISPSTVKFSA
jgi:hypothetical protein